MPHVCAPTASAKLCGAHKLVIQLEIKLSRGAAQLWQRVNGVIAVLPVIRRAYVFYYTYEQVGKNIVSARTSSPDVNIRINAMKSVFCCDVSVKAIRVAPQNGMLADAKKKVVSTKMYKKHDAQSRNEV